MERRFSRFVGIDLGGARGKTTAVAELAPGPEGGPAVVIRSASTRSPDGGPWHDHALWAYAQGLPDDTVIAINAPLTPPPCVRCVRPVCPGVITCEEPAVQWMRTEGERLVGGADGSTRERTRLQPYLHRATEIYLGHGRGLAQLTVTAASTSQVASRAGLLRRRLGARGFVLDANLIEVSPVAAIAAWFGHRRARGYKRDADPWPTRASVLSALADIGFGPTSRFARDEVLRSVHVFDAVISGYVAYRWAREGWRKPPDACVDDGWIWVPPEDDDAA